MHSAAEPERGRSWGPTLIAAAVLGGATLAALPGHVQAGDAGEFSTVMLEGGIPHPSGYPWMRALGLVARLGHMAGLAPATAAAAPCALAGVLGWIVVQRTLASWGAAWTGCWVVCLAGLGTVPMLHVPDAEVWGLHLLWTALFLRLTVGSRPRPPFRIGIVLGLAASHHLTAVLLTPLAIGAAWPREPGARRLLRAGVDGVAGVALGLCVYFTLLLDPGGAWRWGDVTNLEGLLRHVTRADYGTFALSLQGASPPLLSLIQHSASNVVGDLTVGLAANPWAALVVGAAGLVAGARARPGSVPPTAWFGFLTTLVLAAVVFPTFHNLDPRSPFSSWILERFDLLPIMLGTVVLGAVVARGLGRIRHQPIRLTLVGVGLVLIPAQLWRARAHGIPATDESVERYALDVLATPDPAGEAALVFGTDDHRLFPILYAREVLGAGDNVTYVDASLLSTPWYRTWLRFQRPELPEVDKPLRLMGRMWRDPARRDTPIYLTNIFSSPASQQLRLVPEGVLWRVIPPHQPMPDLDTVLARHRQALERLRVAAPSPHPGHPWANDVSGIYVDMAASLATSLRTAGRDAEAQALLEDTRRRLEQAAD